MSQTIQLIKTFKNLSEQQQYSFLQSLTPIEQHYLNINPLLKLDKAQLPPAGDWRYFWFCAGRGVGKTETGIAWIVDRLLTGDIEVAVVGPTHKDLIKEIIPRLLACLIRVFGESEIDCNLSYGIITVQKYKIIKLYSSENEIRGLNANSAYCEEICKWCGKQPDKIEECYKLLNMGVRRKGVNPCQIFNASTPKNFPIFIRWNKEFTSNNPLYQQTVITIDDAIWLDESSRQAIIQDNKGRLGRQELYAEILTDTPGAFWSRQLLDSCIQPLPSQYNHPQAPTNDQLMGRSPKPTPPSPSDVPYLVRTGIGFDPAVSKGNDECGIITASLYSNNKAYVRYDDSGQYNPDEYSKKINQKYKEYAASFVVVEKNNGGNTFDYILRSVNPQMKVIEVHAKQGKLTRAEHTSALYYQNKVFHTDTFARLEDQMCSFSVEYQGSPDRLDALNLVLTELFFPTATANRNPIRNLPSFR